MSPPPSDAIVRVVADPYPPYQYPTGDGGVAGRDQELVASALAAAGLRSSTTLLRWSDCLEAVRDGTADAVFQIAPTPEREGWLAFSNPFRLARTRLYGRAGALPQVGVDDVREALGTLKVGVLEGFSYHPLIDDLEHRVEQPSNEVLLAGVRGGELDLAVMDEGVADHLLDGADDVAPVAGFCLRRPMHLACRRDAGDLLAAFNAGVHAIRGQGA